jgi:mono/diheme cytochrome c family protein
MKLRLILLWIFIASLVAAAGIVLAQTAAPNPVVSSTPIYIQNMAHPTGHLSSSVLAWDALMKYTNVPSGSATAHLVFYFTNVAQVVDQTLTTNVTQVAYATPAPRVLMPSQGSISPSTYMVTQTNVVWVTNSVTPQQVIMNTVHPSCGCTTAQLPPLPWVLLPGTNGQIGVTVNLAGKFGTVVKSIHIETDKGACDLIVQITILPPPKVKLTEADLARQMAIAKVDRQAVFRNDCASCHEKPGEFKYGKELYDTDCGICHEAEHRASMVPDLHALKVATNEDFWRTWISHGKPGTFMPAFSTTEGGPLSDMQIASLAAYLNAAMPSRVPSPQ